MLADGILARCGIDTVVSGVDEPVCGVSSVITAGELDVCGCDSLVYYGAGDSSGVEVVDDVVACGDDTLLPDAFRVGGWLSKVGLGVDQPGWVDGLICAVGTWRLRLPVYVGYPCRYLFALYSVLYFYFVYFTTETADKESWEGCRGRRFCMFNDCKSNLSAHQSSELREWRQLICRPTEIICERHCQRLRM